MRHEIPARLRKQVYERSNMLCENCTGHEGLNIHHIIKRSTWRETENINSLILLCRQCHHNDIENGNGNLRKRLKLDLQAKYFAMGYTEERVRVLMGGMIYEEETQCKIYQM